MKLFTHNLLMCNKKGCTINNYPLRISATKVTEKPHEIDHENLPRLLKKIDFNGLKIACQDLNIPLKVDLSNLTPEQKESTEFLVYMNKLLYECVIEEGAFKCSNCGREYPIHNGICNLVLNDDEL